ncbi:MAG TPA: hypothetical protein VKY74_24515 [Chloroflexia bacterium]|nr:hypothetical protein [Chloroflexia bacterium]
MAKIGIIISYKHRPGLVKEFREWLAGNGAAMLASACGSNERYIGVYLMEGDPTYSIQLHTETSDPAVLEEFDVVNSEKFTRGQTAMKIMWRFLDQSVPPRVQLIRPLHEAAPRPK